MYIIITNRIIYLYQIYKFYKLLFMYLCIDNLNRKKKKKMKQKVITNTYQIKDDHSDTLYMTVNNIQISQCSSNQQSHQMPIPQSILSELQQSQIGEKGLQTAKAVKSNKNSSMQQQQGSKQVNELFTQKMTGQNKFGIKFSANMKKLQFLQSQYLGSLGNELKCLFHKQGQGVQKNQAQIFICLQQFCNQKKLINQFQKNNKDTYLNKSIYNVQNSNINMQNSHSKKLTKSNIQQRQRYKDKMQNMNKLQSRLMCQKCLSQNFHLGHKICTYDKFQQMIHSYNWISTQISKKLISKIEHLRTNIDNYLTLLSNKAIEIMTLGFIKQWEDFKNIFQKYQFNQKLNSKNIQNIKSKSPFCSSLFPQAHDNKCQTQSVQNMKDGSNINFYNQLLDQQIFSANASQVWQKLLLCQQQQADAQIQKMLKYKQESILQQIQYIDINFKQNIANCITNLQFVNNYKDWVFDPNDMSEDSVGLTLDRNRIQGLKPINECHNIYESINSMKSTKLKYPKLNQQNLITSKIKIDSTCKIVFTQKPLRSQSSRSFKIQSLQQEILIACVNKQDHELISNKLNYMNYQKYLYGISINSQGFITVYNKGQKHFTIHNIKLKTNDIIEVTLNNNNTITFLKYSQIDIQNNQKNRIQQGRGKVKRIVIVTLPIQIQQQNYAFYLLAGVTSQGDSVSLTQNLLIQNKIINTPHKDIEKSQQTIKYVKQNMEQNQVKQAIQDNSRKDNMSENV